MNFDDGTWMLYTIGVLLLGAAAIGGSTLYSKRHTLSDIADRRSCLCGHDRQPRDAGRSHQRRAQPGNGQRMNTRATRRLLLVLVSLALLAAACSSSDGGDDQAVEPTTSTAESTTTTATDTTTTAVETTTTTSEPEPDSVASDMPARTQLDWFVEILNAPGEPDTAAIEERFSPEFLEQVSVDQIVGFFPQLFTLAEPPFVVEEFEEGPTNLQGEAVLLGTNGARLTAQISVTADPPHLIEGLLLNPVTAELPATVSIEAIDEQLNNRAAQSSLGVYDVTGGSCEAVHELRTTTPIVLGSVFKLWVLGALAHEIDAGRAAWDETTIVTDALRSSPDGQIFELDTGSEVTLLELAEVMISISDNTATDILISRLGREVVEAEMQRAGVADPSANVPLLSTGNLFELKFLADPPNSDDYRELDEAGRRALLAELDRAVLPWVDPEITLEELAESTNADGVPSDQPRDLDLEWFATAPDLCRTLVRLGQLAETTGLEPVASILEMNAGAGIPFDRDRWPTIRFKGGSEPGVLAGAWWFERADGQRFVVAGGVSDPDEPVGQDAILTLASAIQLVS